MFFILVGHAIVRVWGLPDNEAIVTQPLSSVMTIVVSSIVIVGVDVFVLISGWFGIHARAKGFAKFIFQVLFLLWLIYAAFRFMGLEAFSLEGLKISFGLTGEYWFVMAYLGLYLFSPVLNAFAEQISQRDFQVFLLSFYLFQGYYSWVTATVNYYGGYSITFFCGLYLTAQYFRRYPIRFIWRYSFVIYVVITFLIFIITTAGLYYYHSAIRMLRYDSLLVIAASLSLLFIFSKLQVQSGMVNKVAQSCFAVYVIHFHPWVFKYFVEVDLFIKQRYVGVELMVVMILFLVAVFLCCVLVDQVRIGCWKLLTKKVR